MTKLSAKTQISQADVVLNKDTLMFHTYKSGSPNASRKVTDGQIMTRVFLDNTARAAAVPGFYGQLGVELTTGDFYKSDGLTAGDWVLHVGPNSVLFTDMTNDGTPASTVLTVLKTYTLPANSLLIDGDSLYVSAGGTFAANANTKTLLVRIGGFVFVPQSFITAPNNMSWRVEGHIVRDTAGGSRSFFMFTFSNNVTGAVTAFPYENTIGVDFTTALAIDVAGLNGTASANDIVSNSLFVERKMLKR